MAAQAGHFPTEWPPVPSLGAIQAGLADSEGPLAVQPGSGHRAQGRAGHTFLGCCPEQSAMAGAAKPIPSVLGSETEARSLALALLL